MEEFPSGQRGQTVNLLATLSVVRIHSPPPNLTLYDDKTNVYQFLTCGCSSVVEPRPSKPVARVRSPSPAPDDPLAQSAEHLTFNQGVPRSSRGWVTNFQKKLLTNTAKRSILIKSPKQSNTNKRQTISFKALQNEP